MCEKNDRDNIILNIQTDVLSLNDIYTKHYIEVTKNYILSRFNDWHKETIKKNIELPEHVKKLALMLSTISYIQPSYKDIEYFSSNPKASMLRLAQYVYEHPNQLLRNTRKAIFSFPEHQKIYTEDIGSTYLFQKKFLVPIIQEIENNLSKKNCPITVCEVGAGTGGFTKNILPLLYKNIHKYVISDISKAFTRDLKKQLLSYQDKLYFEKWNIMLEKPYKDVPYNLIIASNVFHSASDIKTVLQNIRNSLSHSGYLLLHETTHGFASNSAIWGFFEELWNYTDYNMRTNGAFLSIDDWCTIVTSMGFELISITDDSCLQTIFLFKKNEKKGFYNERKENI